MSKSIYFLVYLLFVQCFNAGTTGMASLQVNWLIYHGSVWYVMSFVATGIMGSIHG